MVTLIIWLGILIAWSVLTRVYTTHEPGQVPALDVYIQYHYLNLQTDAYISQYILRKCAAYSHACLLLAVITKYIGIC